MASIKIKFSDAEFMIEFTDVGDLETQLKKIDLTKMKQLIDEKIQGKISNVENSKNTTMTDDSITKELGTINLLKISERGQDATKLAIFLASNGMSRENIKKITGITLLS